MLGQKIYHLSVRANFKKLSDTEVDIVFYYYPTPSPNEKAAPKKYPEFE